MAPAAAGERVQPKKHDRRDKLIEIQNEVQAAWAESKVFEAEAGAVPARIGEKFFGNFPYPYMNGMLHLGHAFTLSKVRNSHHVSDSCILASPELAQRTTRV